MRGLVPHLYMVYHHADEALEAETDSNSYNILRSQS